ncbi:DUF4385 domain-containing protein [Nitrosospira lacus]|uniref:Uncharacterized protein n=2 Tax=Nitrosospira lacus TaxID=1288494 RepID=A0A1W6SPS2_9PROT|nr:DUF4385 domain-containing protein [Nitrosospira lacus]
MPRWRFKTPDISRNSGTILNSMFENYLKAWDLRCDMARKINVNQIIVRRCANYKSGKKYVEMIINGGIHARSGTIA